RTATPPGCGGGGTTPASGTPASGSACGTSSTGCASSRWSRPSPTGESTAGSLGRRPAELVRPASEARVAKFSIQESRDRLAGPNGGADIALKQDFEESKAVKGLGSSAGSFLNEAVECLLVGLEDLGTQLLHKARRWLQVAIKTAEVPRRYVRHRTEAHRFEDLALCNWLLEDAHDQDSLSRAAAHQEQLLAAAPAEPLPGALVGAFQVFLDAGEHAKIVRLCEQHDLFPLPEDLDGCAISPDIGVMCRILAQHRLCLGFPDKHLKAALTSFLPAAIGR